MPWWFFPCMTVTLAIGYIVGFLDARNQEEDG
jgi:hypothetical protein